LLAKRPAPSTWMSTGRPPSRASSLLRAFVHKYPDRKTNLWELACQRRGRHIQHGCRLAGRHREQARSYARSYTNIRTGKQTCGSWLASEEAGTFNMDVDWQAAIASKLAPTRVRTQISGPENKPVGAGLPAKRAAHPTWMSAARPALRASRTISISFSSGQSPPVPVVAAVPSRPVRPGRRARCCARWRRWADRFRRGRTGLPVHRQLHPARKRCS